MKYKPKEKVKSESLLRTVTKNKMQRIKN